MNKIPNLEICSLSMNKIRTLRDLQHCNKLAELYLRKNEVADLREINFLRNLKSLKTLWLSENPCASTTIMFFTIL